MRPNGPGLMPAQPWLRAAVTLAFFALMLALCAGTAMAQQRPTVHAVLFYSPTCPHCHQVIGVDLPPLVRQYGGRLQILTISTADSVGRELYRAAVRRFAIAEGRRGVPTLIVGTTVLVGSDGIPAQLPGIVARAMAESGLDWPDVPGLRALVEPRREPATPPAGDAAPTDTPGAWPRARSR